ncbi:MAG: MBOAT family protein [Ferruginibacter sp.]|nr:MBOAT family protein [Ferruginibacter sp.]
MLFNSLQFAFFLPVIFLLYWYATRQSVRLQNYLMLAASYFFYACWDYRFLGLLIFSTLLDYFTAIQMANSTRQNQKRFWFWLSIAINLGFLGVFKYYNFFAASFADGLSLLGLKANPATLQVILPVGISFYTFHGLSYVIDIYNNKIKPERNFVDYALFVSFFPLLVAGPIERATHLLPQIQQPRVFDYTKAVDGLRQILWGLFKKVVIADNCAVIANAVFDGSANYPGSAHVIGAVFFAFQIYCDFSGYSDIAIGTARLFGIELLRNFSYPYFSRNIAEFWRRWHISLSSWFRDYLYIPLGGSKGSTWRKIRNVFIIFIVSGFWHGANWTFIVWGLLNALFIIPSVIARTNRNNLDVAASGKTFPSFGELASMIGTFGLTVFAWIFFRAESLGHAGRYLAKIFSRSIFDQPNLQKTDVLLTTSFFILCLVLLEWRGRANQHALADVGTKWRRPVRWVFYYGLLMAICVFAGSNQQFIYFQF